MIQHSFFYGIFYILRMWGRSLTARGRLIIAPTDSILKFLNLSQSLSFTKSAQAQDTIADGAA